MSHKKYRIILDTEIPGKRSGQVFITEEGAKIIWAAYEALFNKYSSGQSMETRESRGGICWLSELNSWKKQGVIDPDFDYNDYLFTDSQEDR